MLLSEQLAHTGRVVGRGLTAALSPLDLDLRHYRVLAAVANRCGCSQRSLTDELGIPPSRVVAILDNLEERGAIRRAPSPADRRAHALTLTPEGRALLADASAAVARCDARLVGGLDDTEHHALARFLARIEQAAGSPGPRCHT
jgi:DNA-binding MarR family transcriptional regulator